MAKSTSAKAPARRTKAVAGKQQEVKFIGFQDSVKNFFTRYFEFSGVSTRAEYWWVWAFSYIITYSVMILAVIYFVANGVALSQIIHLDAEAEILTMNLGYLSGPPMLRMLDMLWLLFLLIPTLSLWSRRLHDINKSAWNMLWIFVPIVGWVIMFVQMLSRSVRKGNRFIK